MTRLSRDEALMASAKIWAQRGTCSRLQVGAVFSRNGRILVQGYNGTPAGLPHCEHLCDCHSKPRPLGTPGTTRETDWHYEDCPTQKPCTQAEHAERNAIAFAARHGVALEGSYLHVTHAPCLPCAMSIVNAGVEIVIYEIPYRVQDGIAMLQKADIGVVQMLEFQV